MTIDLVLLKDVTGYISTVLLAALYVPQTWLVYSKKDPTGLSIGFLLLGLLLTCDESRSQHKNKEIVIKRFVKIITNGLKVPKKRKPTKPSKSSIKKRLEKKKKQASKKALRNKPEL